MVKERIRVIRTKGRLKKKGKQNYPRERQQKISVKDKCKEA